MGGINEQMFYTFPTSAIDLKLKNYFKSSEESATFVRYRKKGNSKALGFLSKIKKIIFPVNDQKPAWHCTKVLLDLNSCTRLACGLPMYKIEVSKQFCTSLAGLIIVYTAYDFCTFAVNGI